MARGLRSTKKNSDRVRAGVHQFYFGSGPCRGLGFDLGPKSDPKKGESGKKKGKFWVRANAKTPGPVRAGMDHRPLVKTP